MTVGTGFWPSLRREWRLLAHRPWDLAMLTWVPALAVALLCWIFAAGQPQRLPIAVWNQDAGSLSRALTRMLAATPGLAVTQQVHSSAEAQWALQAMDVYAVLHIPPGTTRHIRQGTGAHVTLLHNAQLFTHSGLIQRDVRQVIATFSAGVEMQARAARGEPQQALQVRMEPIKTHLTALFNVSNNYEMFLAFALIPALLHVLAMTAGAWTVGRELRDRTLGQWLAIAAAPTGRPDASGAASSSPAPQQRPPGGITVLAALAGKLALPWLSLGSVGAAGLLYLTQLRGWEPAGSLPWVMVALAALVAVSLVMGALLAALTLSLRTALSGSALLSAPAFAFSGVGFPLLAMTDGAHRWAISMPYTHYIRLQIEQLQMGADIAQGLPIISALLLATVLGLLLATLGLRRAATLPARWGGR